MVHCTFMRQTRQAQHRTVTFWLNQPALEIHSSYVSWGATQLPPAAPSAPAMADKIEKDDLASTLDLLRETMSELQVETNKHTHNTNTWIQHIHIIH